MFSTVHKDTSYN
jgi:hypothetical protein